MSKEKSSQCIFYSTEKREGSQSESRKQCGDAKELEKRVDWISTTATSYPHALEAGQCSQRSQRSQRSQ